MLVQLSFAALAGLAAAHPKPQIAPRIVGGEAANPNDFPFMVALRVGDQLLCGGALIASNVVLTAAHCTYDDIAGLSVHSSATTLTSREYVSGVASIIRHPSWNSDHPSDNDIAIWKLTGFNDEAAESINFVNVPQADTEPAGGEWNTLYGWGALSDETMTTMSTNLNKVSLPIIDRTRCNELWQGLPDTKICAGFENGGADACRGDSGGPLVNSDHVIVGVTSAGPGTCAKPGKPTTYTRVSKFSNWIWEVVNQ